MSRIAVLGTGAMGSRIVQNLLKTKHEVVVYNRTPDKVTALLDQGATYAATPKQAAEQAEIVISIVTDNQVSSWIWLDPETGAAQGLAPDAIAIESSTLTVDWVKTLATQIQMRGAAFLDAPMVGSRPQVEAGKLIYLVGGAVETLAKVQEVLLSAGAASVHAVGEIGQATAMKLAVNALLGIQLAALAEAIGLLNHQGIPIAKAMDCLSQLPIMSPAASFAGNLMVANNHTPLFPIELVEKDFRYAVESAQEVNATIPIAMATHAVYQEAIAQGYGSDNITGVVQLFT
ncbi:MAG: NAD(P)-dependent oxidoreductase [Oscillatoriophycideae cyanobacterium NC_groundwater_1537_Pr4_S-0.65um_50_18]|nr:NAD(P)-dependent oxidoreductase [Oscillatoriophycideae cyanobacterium NC_groundwater_1537_Pr4_S-0.65um_50_18]